MLHLVHGSLGYTAVLALHCVLSAYETQIAGTQEIILRIHLLGVLYVNANGLVVEGPEVGEVNVGRLVGGAGQKKGLVYIGHNVRVERLLDVGAVHDEDVGEAAGAAVSIFGEARVVALVHLGHAQDDQIAVLENAEMAAAVADGHVVLGPLNGGLGRALWVTDERCVSADGCAHCALHGLLDKRGRKLDDAQLGRRISFKMNS